jgi:hypothetical protein
MHIVSGILRAVLWLLAAILIAVGAAGLAVAANPIPDELSRPEIYARADAVVAPGVATIDARLREVQGLVATLSGLSRSAIVALNGGDQDALVAALDEGDRLVLEIGGLATTVAADLRSMPYDGDSYELSPPMAGRLIAAEEAVQAVRPLADLWGRVARGALPASEVAQHLAEHDRATFAATQDGTRDPGHARRGGGHHDARHLDRAQPNL